MFTYENKYTSSLAWGGWVRAAVVCWSSTSPSLFDDGEPNEKREKNFFFASRFFSLLLAILRYFFGEGGIRAKLRNPPVISSYSCSFSMDATHDTTQRARAASLPPSFFSVCVFLSTVHGWFGIWRRWKKWTFFFAILRGLTRCCCWSFTYMMLGRLSHFWRGEKEKWRRSSGGGDESNQMLACSGMGDWISIENIRI